MKIFCREVRVKQITVRAGYKATVCSFRAQESSGRSLTTRPQANNQEFQNTFNHQVFTKPKYSSYFLFEDVCTLQCVYDESALD